MGETLTGRYAFRVYGNPALAAPALGIGVGALSDVIGAAASASGVLITLLVPSDTDSPSSDAFSLFAALASRSCPLSLPSPTTEGFDLSRLLVLDGMDILIPFAIEQSLQSCSFPSGNADFLGRLAQRSLAGMGMGMDNVKVIDVNNGDVRLLGVSPGTIVALTVSSTSLSGRYAYRKLSLPIDGKIGYPR